MGEWKHIRSLYLIRGWECLWGLSLYLHLICIYLCCLQHFRIVDSSAEITRTSTFCNITAECQRIRFMLPDSLQHLGGLVTMLPLLLNLCATMMFIPALKPSGNGLFIHSGAYIMGNLFCEHPLIYVLIYVLQFFIYGGSFALVSLAVSFFIDNTFLVIISPFVTYYGLGIISTLCKSVMNIYSFNPMALLSPATKLQDGMLFAYICEPIIICVICGIIFFMKGKNNEAL